MEPDNAKFNSAITYSENKEFEEAIKVLTRLLENDPDNVSLHIERGMAYIELEDDHNSIKDLQQAVNLSPENPISHYTLGLAYMTFHLPEKAISEFEDAINLSDDEDEQIIGESLFQLGNVFFNVQDLNRASKFFEEAIAYLPEHIYANCNLGICLTELGEPESALIYFDKILNSNNKVSNALFGRACAYAILTDFESAIRDYLDYLKLVPEDGCVWLYLGNCYMELKDTISAHNAWIKAETLGEMRASIRIKENSI
ncbi:MAG: tetratricopeptide repeat protein [Leptospiraceae bacterium]|nr:tetratricopeptide repeat protein [Leptospiraceae bacterium]MCK6382406.1 tetratricopeptide repeat protein [Leptospiraceae bacterium]